MEKAAGGTGSGHRLREFPRERRAAGASRAGTACGRRPRSGPVRRPHRSERSPRSPRGSQAGRRLRAASVPRRSAARTRRTSLISISLARPSQAASRLRARIMSRSTFRRTEAAIQLTRPRSRPRTASVVRASTSDAISSAVPILRQIDRRRMASRPGQSASNSNVRAQSDAGSSPCAASTSAVRVRFFCAGSPAALCSPSSRADGSRNGARAACVRRMVSKLR